MNQEDEKKKKILSNACTIVFNCQDLLTKILLPFPARFLVKLKIVSKQFHYEISEPQFCIDHLRLHHRDRESLAPTSLYFYSSFSSYTEIYSVSISSPERSVPSLSVFETMGFLVDRQFKIVQSCNGLLLCSFDNGNSPDSSSPSSRSYLVCNPTTNAFRILPELPRVESSSTSKESENQEDFPPPVLTLAFNPLETHVYKVFGIRIVNKRMRKNTCELMVYSSDEGGRAWRKCSCDLSIPVIYNGIRHGVFHDSGYITWVCERGMIYFDVQAEKTIDVKIGYTQLTTWKNIRFFGEGIDGSLQLIKLRVYPYIEVSQLRTGTSEWIPILRHRLGHWMGYSFDSADRYQILAVADRGKTLILAMPGRVICCNRGFLDPTVLRTLPRQQSPEEFSFDPVNSFQFVETLSPV